jgi:hypothetical protein
MANSRHNQTWFVRQPSDYLRESVLGDWRRSNDERNYTVKYGSADESRPSQLMTCAVRAGAIADGTNRTSG